MEFAGGENARVNPEKFNWTGRRFLIPAGVNVWAAYCATGSGRDNLSLHEFQ